MVLTSLYTYFIECKNLVGNITVNEKGDFIRELNINGKKIKELEEMKKKTKGKIY